ncbi:putative umta methyltransferase family protein [Botrytis fragariae]|uniref:Putative umta methyltransferase family protein n=1 Tax=Botrytis fragariae TaxID=1964551 RepID=A0A8H6B1W4_9HELO|nr:putative umta methyltransferase family protein [Botrytis fragariae]KAF5877869.1 putative umta methyltransferase family protein [Botrytis fragariae]
MGENTIQEDYMFSRGFRDSARLHIQHLLWNIRLGWLLHPSILVPTAPKKEDMFSVADVGIGSADWLLELSQKVSPNVQLRGFDISNKLFPAKEFLPSNMKLEILDAFGTLPEHIKGKFDVVHIRAFTIVIKGGHPGVLLDNLIAMLKPGGFLQWDEMDSASFSAHSPNEFTPKVNMELVIDRFQDMCKKSGLDFGWISNLAKICNQQGLKVVDNFRLPCNDVLRQMTTDNYLMGLEDLGYVVSERALGERTAYRQAFNKAVLETRKGVSISMDMIIVVCQLEKK